MLLVFTHHTASRSIENTDIDLGSAEVSIQQYSQCSIKLHAI